MTTLAHAEPFPGRQPVAGVSGVPDRWAAIALQLAHQADRDAVLARVVTAALAYIDGAQHAGITLSGHVHEFTPVVGDDVAGDVERQQYATGEGPGLSAATKQAPVIDVLDLHADDRWPRFAAAVAHLGIRSALSFHLYTVTGGAIDTVGALTVYATRPAAFSRDSIDTGIALASHTAIAVAAAELGTHLRTALRSRDVIGQAKGILMERFKITAEQAFDLLIAASQRTHRKLRDLAELLTVTGELGVPDLAPPPPCGAGLASRAPGPDPSIAGGPVGR